MNRLFSVLLLMALLLSLCACADSGEQQAEKDSVSLPALDDLGEYGLYAGFGRKNISPQEPIGLGGYSNASVRISQQIQDDLYVTAIALTDAQGNTVIFMNWDAVRSYPIEQDSVRMSIAQKTGVDANNIYIGATHSHSCPDLTESSEALNRYKVYLVEQSVACAIEALQDRRPANMSAGTIEAEGLNFVRHYMTTLDDGTITYFGDNFNTAVYNDSTTHTSEADPTMFMLYFDTAEGSDMCLTNWRAHPHFTGGTSAYNVSSDWVGAFRDAFEYQSGVDMLYFNGAAGNINGKSRISNENITTDYKEYGRLLADYAISLIQNNLEPVVVDQIQTKQTIFQGQVNHAQDHLYAKAIEVWGVWKATGDSNATTEAGKPYGIRSRFHASAIISNMKRDSNQPRELNAILLGKDVSLVTAPNELFDTNAVWLEENSPTKYTLTLGYTNGHYGYLPSELAWEYTCYETDITYLVQGTAEQYQECFLELIKTMHGQ